jgi:DNA-binding MurR/RpiR family transcriptional regulator
VQTPEESAETATLQQRVAASAGRLSPKERRVAEYLQANPGRAAVSSAAALARLIGTSDATVVRTATSLGYPSFSKLRRSLAEEGPVRIDRADRPAPDGDVLATSIADTLSVIEQLRDEHVAAAWSAAAELLGGAARVWTLGFGPAAAVAEFLALALGRIGVESRAVTTTGFRMADDLLHLRAGDALVVFAPVRLFQEIDAALARAREVGAGTVVVSEALGLTLRGRVDVVVSTPGTTHNSASELAAGLLVAQSLALQLAHRDRDRSLDRLQELDRLRTRVVGGPLDAV